MRAGQDAPAHLSGAPRVCVDDAVAAEPRPAAELLHRCWVERRPVVVELAVSNATLREPEQSDLAPHALPSWFTFDRERLHRLMWANNVDLRGDTPTWWHGVKAQRLDGAGAAPSTVADIHLDGEDVWVDGGPRGPLPVAHVHAETIDVQRARERPRLTALRPAPPEPAPPALAELAPDQRAAVLHASGPARIIAPAGSGKTRVLTARLRHLLGDAGHEPGLVTALAYNTRAAEEMRQRTPGVRASIRTLHSFAWWVVRQAEQREVVDERRVREVLQRFVKVARTPNTDPWQSWLEALSDVRLGLRTPAEVEAERGDVDGFTDVFDRYREELARRGWVDFDEQVYRAIELLLGDPDLRRAVQQRCTHLLVDEFQDLTPAFLLLVRLVSAPWLQVFGVGDDDQTIYGHVGASPEYLVDYDHWFPGAADHPLEVNYRCPDGVVGAAATLLGHNGRRVDKQVRPGPAATQDEPHVHLVPTGAMTQRVVRLLEDQLDVGASPADLAVLARVNASLLPLQVALAEAGVPRTAPVEARVLERTGMRTALAYLRIAANPDDIRRRDVDETVRRPSRKLSTASRELLGNRGRWSMDALETAGLSLDGLAADRWQDYLEDLRLLVRAAEQGGDVGRLLALVRDRIGLGDAMEGLDASRTRPTGSAHADDLDALEQLAGMHPELDGFEAWLRSAVDRPGDDVALVDGQDGAREPAVTLSTVHRVKGMEWDHVVVHAASDGLFPHRLSEGVEAVEEERRVFHVAMTRARRSLHVVGARSAPSPFLAELAEPAARDEAAETDDELPTPSPRFGADTEGEVVVADRGLALALPGGIGARVLGSDPEGVLVRVARDGGLTDDADRSLAPFEMVVGEGTPVTVEGRTARLRRPTAIKPKPRVLDLTGREVEGSDADPVVVERLRTWRSQRAREDGVPAYVVLHDRHLEAIASSMPDDLRALGRCPGIGPTKLDRYGDDLLEVLAAG